MIVYWIGLILAVLSCLIPLVSGNRQAAFNGFSLTLAMLFLGAVLLFGGK